MTEPMDQETATYLRALYDIIDSCRGSKIDGVYIGILKEGEVKQKILTTSTHAMTLLGSISAAKHELCDRVIALWDR
jgi:hypothetical protein